MNHVSPLKLKCSIKGHVHSCKWTESYEDEVLRRCTAQYARNSTHSDDEKHVICEVIKTNTNNRSVEYRKESKVHNEQKHSCILEVSPGNLTIRTGWVTWGCSFNECENYKCLKENSCTVQATIKVFVSF